MLVAKYAKNLFRTGTQPFLFTCHVGDSHRDCNFKSLRAICNPLASQPPQRSLISRIAIYLATCVDGILCLPTFRGFGNVQHFVNDSQASDFPYRRRAKKEIKKYTCVESGLPRGFSARGFRRPGIQCTQPADRDLLTRRSHRLRKWGDASTITRQSSRSGSLTVN